MIKKKLYFCKYKAVVNAVQVKFPCIFIPLLLLNQTALQQKRILKIALFSWLWVTHFTFLSVYIINITTICISLFLFKLHFCELNEMKMISLHFCTILKQNKADYSMASLNCYSKYYIIIILYLCTLYTYF